MWARPVRLRRLPCCHQENGTRARAKSSAMKSLRAWRCASILGPPGGAVAIVDRCSARQRIGLNSSHFPHHSSRAAPILPRWLPSRAAAAPVAVIASPLPPCSPALQKLAQEITRWRGWAHAFIASVVTNVTGQYLSNNTAERVHRLCEPQRAGVRFFAVAKHDALGEAYGQRQAYIPSAKALHSATDFLADLQKRRLGWGAVAVGFGHAQFFSLPWGRAALARPSATAGSTGRVARLPRLHPATRP
jgi:hypothetical protein